MFRAPVRARPGEDTEEVEDTEEMSLHPSVTHSLIVCPRSTTHGTAALTQDSMQLDGKLCGLAAFSVC